MQCKPCRSNRFGAAVAIAVAVATAITSSSTAEKAAPTVHGQRSFSVEVSGEGPPVVLIAGLNSSGEVWNGTVDRFQDRYQLHVLTLAGFGGTPALEDGPFLERVVEDLEAYLENENLSNAAVVGHSLGGFLAYRLAMEAPQQVGAVVAVDGVPFLPALFQPNASVESSRGPAEAMRASLLASTPEQRAAQARYQLAQWTKGERNLDFVVGMAAESDPKATGQAMVEVMTTDLREAVGHIEVPTLLIGAGDVARTPEMRAQIAANYRRQIEAIPTHRFVLAEKARHFVMLDDPSFFYTTLREFLDSAIPADRQEAPAR